MKKIFQLSKSNLELAKAEVLSLLNSSNYQLIDNLLIVEDDSNLGFEKRLGYTHAIYEFLFQCMTKDLLRTAQEFDWHRIYNKDFCVRAHGRLDERLIAGIIYNKLKHPKVNLSNPTTKIEIFCIKNFAVAGKLLSHVDKSYLKRKAHLRPSLHPTSLHPALARACINLTGLTYGKLLDPFCGSGGILIEAGLIGFKVTGYDIDENQIKRAKNNLQYYKIKSYELKHKDALNINEKVDAIVTDPPFGIGAKVKDIDNLYKNFLKISHNFTSKMVICFPDFLNYRNYIQEWVIKNKFRIYIHKSLSKIITVLESC